MKKAQSVKRQAGFSLLELLTAVALLTIIMGAIFSQINNAQQHSSSEQVKMDLFQQSREFMDQMSRDLRAAGYPNQRNFSTDPASPPQNSQLTAAGLVKLDKGELWFEGSIDGSGTVSVIHYKLDSTDCTPLPCLRRSESLKLPVVAPADITTEQANSNPVTEVQNVLQGSASDPLDGDPIFQAFLKDGTSVTLPVDIMNNATTIANIDTIAVKLTVQSPYPDPKTHQMPTVTLFSTVRLTNCSAATAASGGTVMGC